MKRNNLGEVERLVFDGLKRRDATSSGGYVPASVTFAAVKDDSHKQSEASKILNGVLGRFNTYDSAAHRVAGDSRLTGKQRATLIAPERAEATRALANGFDLLRRQQQINEIDRSKLFRVPGYDGDAAQATLDREIRDRIRAMPVSSRERSKLNEEIAAGKNDQALFALLRDPFDNPDKLGVQGIHNARVETANADKVKELAESDEHLQHAATVLSALSNVLDAMPATDLPGDMTP